MWSTSRADGALEDISPLNYNRASEEFKSRFVRLADDDMLADCEFVVGPQKTVIKGHKVLFGAASNVFHAMLHGESMKIGPVHVEDLEPEGFQGMKRYIYSSKTDFKSVFEALATLIAAHKYLIEPLVQECVKFINNKLNGTQVLEFFDCCKRNRTLSTFEELCSKIIKEKTADVVKSGYFTSASIEAIEEILKSPTLKLKSEMEVFDLFERWALAEVQRQGILSKDIATSFNSLKKHIRFLTIEENYYKARVETSPLLTSEEKNVIAANKKKFNPNLRSENISLLRGARNFFVEPPQYRLIDRAPRVLTFTRHNYHHINSQRRASNHYTPETPDYYDENTGLWGDSTDYEDFSDT